ncbi:MAG: DUF5615 family PIN-like protein [Deltaproteobacteria bacterium]|nr:DUF5615 family PIN-like protein [Deltaproteobacteria bacterium]
MRVLLDENFPLALVRRLRNEGHDPEYIIKHAKESKLPSKSEC